MKKLLAASLLALGMVLATDQQASAWQKLNISIGANLNWEGGNNNLLWGAYRGGAAPGYPTDVYQGFFSNNPLQGQGAGLGPMMAGGGPPAYPAPTYMDHHGGMPGVQPLPGGMQPMPPAVHGPQLKPAETQAIYYTNNNYQPVGYTYPTNHNHYQYPATNNYYQYPTHGYPQSGYGNYQVPSYWYGN